MATDLHDERSLEGQWLRLRERLEIAEGGWYAFLFTNNGATAGELRRRVVAWQRAHAQMAMAEHIARSPEQLGPAVQWLFGPDTAQHRSAWLEGIAIDSSDPAAPTPWHDAWLQLLTTLNRHRDGVLAHVGGPVVIAAPRDHMALVQQYAPDLWSFRSLVMHTDPVPAAAAALRAADVQLPVAVALLVTDRETAAASIALAKAAETVRGLLASKEPKRAREAAHALVELARNPKLAGVQRGNALSLAAEAAEADGDVAAAWAWICEAVAIDVDDDDAALVWAERAHRLGQAVGPIDARFRLANQAVARARRNVEREESAEATQRLAYWLVEYGDIAAQGGAVKAARSAFDESLSIRRRVHSTWGVTPEALHSISVALDRLGRIAQQHGDFAAAKVAFDEALSIDRRVVDSWGDSPESLRGLAVGLHKHGDFAWQLGDMAAARLAFDEALAIARRILASWGETPKALSDLATMLTRRADVDLDAGDHISALSMYGEAMSVRRRVLAVLGGTPDTLRGLSIGLERIGKVAQATGDLASARAAAEESLAVRRRILATWDPTPQALRDVSVALSSVCEVEIAADNLDIARSACIEAMAIARNISHTWGDTPQTLTDLAEFLDRLAGLDPDHAAAYTAEAVGLRAHAENLRQSADPALNASDAIPQPEAIKLMPESTRQQENATEVIEGSKG